MAGLCASRQTSPPIGSLHQVWRPSPTSGGGGGVCYSLVGENRFPEVTFPPGDLVRESPLSSDRISVRPGDVLGYFVSSNRRDGMAG